METLNGSCRLGLWHVHVYWNGDLVSRIRFSRTGIEGDVPFLIRQYCAGKPVDLGAFSSVAIHGDTPYSHIYRAVREIPYGKTATYGEIARRVGTSPRVVGQAMARNPTPLVIPCHRVVAATGIGGFSPDIGIKELLLERERRRGERSCRNPVRKLLHREASNYSGQLLERHRTDEICGDTGRG